jgi:hypothetical protein
VPTGKNITLIFATTLFDAEYRQRIKTDKRYKKQIEKWWGR